MSKINYTQKEILANFMSEHTDFAKNILPNSSQGKAKSHQLWEHLTRKLNASGPPIKDAKVWRKVYADQKQNVRKKLSFNNSSKKRTGGGPYEEKVLSHVEEQLMVAAGMDVAVKGLSNIRCFGSENNCTPTNENYVSIATSQQNDEMTCTLPCLISDSEEQVQRDFSSLMEIEFDVEEEKLEPSITNKKFKELPEIRVKENKTNLLKKNIMSVELYQQEMLKRLDKLIEISNKRVELKVTEVELANQLLEINKKNLKMNEMEHEMTIQIKAMELQIRRKELATTKYSSNPYLQSSS